MLWFASVQLLGRSSGFTVAPTHRPCTKGLWMWSSPVKRTAPDGSDYSLLLLDSEGIDAYDQTVSFSFFLDLGAILFWALVIRVGFYLVVLLLENVFAPSFSLSVYEIYFCFSALLTVERLHI
jgi:hypothetical protein